MTSQRTAPSISRRDFVGGLALSPFAVAAPRYTWAHQATPTPKPDVYPYTFGDAWTWLPLA